MIKGITPALSEAGKIKIGYSGERYTTRNGKQARRIVKLDHFIITKTEKNKNDDFIIDEDMMNAVRLACKTKDNIKEIPIVLHSDNIDEIFPTKYAYYAGSKVFCRGDGESAERLVVKNKQYTGEKKTVDCTCDYLKRRDCKPNGTLHCSLALPGHAVAGAVYMWRTTSIISIQRMIGSLEQIKAVCGTLRGIPLWLKLSEIEVSPTVTTRDGPRVINTKVHCCHVELRAKDLLEVQRKALELASMRAALSGGIPPKALIKIPAGDNESAEESADVQEEFYPEVMDADTGEIVEGLKKFDNNDNELWGFSEAVYEDSSSVTNGTPPPPKSESPKKRKEEPLQSEKVA